jgi:hypothetical protein
MRRIKNLCEECSLLVGASCIELFEITQNFGSHVLKLACVVLGWLLMSVAGRKVQLILCMLKYHAMGMHCLNKCHAMNVNS